MPVSHLWRARRPGRFALLAFLVVGCGVRAPKPPELRAQPLCRLDAPSTVLRQEGAAVLEMWTVPDKPVFFRPGAPDDAGLTAFRRAVRQAAADQLHPVEEAPEGASPEEQDLWRRERANAERVYSGDSGRVRPMSCLEAILFARQNDRYSELSDPTEFIASVLRKGNRLRIYFGSSDQMFPPKWTYARDQLESDVAAGWNFEMLLHNHTVTRRHGRLILGVPAPGTSDVQVLRSVAAELHLHRVLVTNGLYTGDIPAEALDQFEGRE